MEASPLTAEKGSSGAVLTTKLYAPQTRATLVSRPRLTRKLDEGQGCRLTLVCAPAGFGKTTLLGDWIARRDKAVGWLSLDQGDNEPVRFLTHLVAGLQRLHAGIGETVQAALHSPQPPPVESLLTLLLNELTPRAEPFSLVLDDYHLIRAESVHRAVNFLLEHLPPQFHLIITSRSDPPLPLARLRARGELLELRSDELRFTAEETATFLNDAMGLSLSAEDIVALEEHTEGWIAGLQLAALSMQGRGDLSGFIAAFTGSHRYILDYLVEEVLQDQAEDVQRFLLQTSILERLTGPLCDAVTAQSGSQEVLESLERANLFLIPLDDDRRWYRYHHLFAEVLQNRLQSATPPLSPPLTGGMKGGVAELHRRASLWFEREGLLDEALRHALAAPDLEQAATLVEQYAWPMFAQGEILTVRAWLEQLPQTLVCSRPRLTTTSGFVLTVTGQPEAAERLLAETAFVFTPDTSPEVRGELALVRSTLARFQRDVAGTIGFAQEALEHLPQDRLMPRGVALYNLAQIHLHASDFKAAGQVLGEMVKLSEAGNPTLALLALFEMGMLQTQQGYLPQALETYRSAIDRAARIGKQGLSPFGKVYTALGVVLYERNDLDGAAAVLRRGTHLLRGSIEQIILAYGYGALAYVQQAQGDDRGALSTLEQAEGWLTEMRLADRGFSKVLMNHRVQLWLRQGNLEAARGWAETSGLSSNDPIDPVHVKWQYPTLARVLIAKGQAEAAVPLLDRLVAAAEIGGWTGRLIELLGLRALARQALGDTSAALGDLERALSLGEPGGYVRTFIDEGEPMASLLREAAVQSIAPSYVAELLAAYLEKIAVKAKPAEQLPNTLLEPLSERELTILRLMSAGLSDKEIARELSLSVNTIKWYAQDIYGKLGVSKRTKAVAHARLLGML